MSALVRFVIPAIIDRESQTATGVVHVAHNVVDDIRTSDEIRRELSAALQWLEEHLDVPDRFNRTKLLACLLRCGRIRVPRRAAKAKSIRRSARAFSRSDNLDPSTLPASKRIR